VRIPRDIVDAVRDRTDLVAVVGRHVKLVRRGSSHVGLCPFHQEKSPSFNVVPAKGIFHCFGCQASGDVFKFLQLLEGLSFSEAVRELAGPAGIEVEERALGPAERAAMRARATLYDVQEEALAFYEQVLWTRPEGAPGRDYLARRGLTDEAARKARLGFAPSGWSSLLDHLTRKGFAPPLLADAGLVRERREGRGYYDTFRERLLFPIRDERSRPIAFGGRILEGDGPKYINSPETRLYQKGSVLYGLDQARLPIQQRDRALIVEGYFDVLSLVQAGFGEAIATCGTALTAEHLEKIRRLTRNVVLVLDADEAGLRAAERALPLFLAAGVLPWRLTLPDAKDPDELVRTQGADAMQRALAAREPLLEWALGRKLAAAGGGALARERVLEDVLPWLTAVDDDALHRQVARRLGVPEPALEERIARARAAQPTAVQNEPPPAPTGWRPHRDINHILWMLVHRYAQVADLVARVDPSLFDDHAPVQPVLARLVSGEPAAAILPDVRDPGVQRALAAVCARATLVEEADAARATCDVLARLQRPRRKAQLAVHTDEVSAFLRDGDTAGYRVAAARRAALVQTEKALETALTQGEVGSAIALLAAWPAPPWTAGST
jgi:DNA primase